MITFLLNPVWYRGFGAYLKAFSAGAKASLLSRYIGVFCTVMSLTVIFIVGVSCVIKQGLSRKPRNQC